MNDKAASTAREELLESRLRIERLGEKLNALQKQVLPASLPLHRQVLGVLKACICTHRFPAQKIASGSWRRPWRQSATSTAATRKGKKKRWQSCER